MTDLEQRLTDHLQRRAAAATPRFDLEGIERSGGDRAEAELTPARHRPHAYVRVAVAAALVVLIGAAGLVATRHRDRDEGVTSSPGPTGLLPGLELDSTMKLPPGPIWVDPAIWTGKEVIVFGHSTETSPFRGAAFDPETRTWRMTAPAPIPGGDPVAWTGSEVIVWGAPSTPGAAYDPEADTWRGLAAAPFSTVESVTAWTGDELIAVGGGDLQGGGNTPTRAAAYDPQTNEWRDLASLDHALALHAPAVWTGTTLLTIVDVDGPDADTQGNGSGQRLARYDVDADAWSTDGSSYVSLVGIPDRDGVTRTALAMPSASGRPVDVLDATGSPIRSLPAHPVNLADASTAARGAWVGEQAVFWIDDDVLVHSAEAWALDPVAGTWRPLPDEVATTVNEGRDATPMGDVLLLRTRDGYVAYRPPS